MEYKEYKNSISNDKRKIIDLENTIIVIRNKNKQLSKQLIKANQNMNRFESEYLECKPYKKKYKQMLTYFKKHFILEFDKFD